MNAADDVSADPPATPTPPRTLAPHPYTHPITLAQPKNTPELLNAVPADPGQQLDYLGLTVMNYIVATNGGEAKFSQEVKEKLIQASHTGAFQQQGGPRAAGLLLAQAGATEARKKDFALLGKLSYRIKQLIKTRHNDNTNRLMSEFFDLFPKLVQPVSSSSSSDVTIHC